MFIKHLSFIFNKENVHYFFDNVQMRCSRNALNMITGDNGVGKSTLLSILRGSIGSQVGLKARVELDDVTYDAVDNRLPLAFTHQVHMVHQKYDLMLADQFTFKQNLQFARLSEKPFLARLPEPMMLDIATSIGINVDIPVYHLSGGQRQLLAILMALAKPTKVLLLDEPTATLDKHNATFIMDMLTMLAEQLQVTMLIICHDHTIINHYGKRCFVIEKCDNGQRTITEVHGLKI